VEMTLRLVSLSVRKLAAAPSASSVAAFAPVAARSLSIFAMRSMATRSSSPSGGSGRLADRVAVITGGAAGIGRESAILFAKEGCKVVVADMNETEGEQTVQTIKDNGGKAVFVRVNVAKEKECENMIKLAESKFGKLDVLFNNAGIMMDADDGAVTTEEKVFDQTFAVNVKGVFFGCKYGIPAMKRAGGGSIINTASFVARLGAATPQLAYTGSKGAVLSMTRELAVIHARENIRVNALCPGPLRTELLMKFLNTEEKKQRRLVHIPMGRFGEAKEMASAALFLASSESSYMTGAEFLVDGGITAAYVTPLSPK